MLASTNGHSQVVELLLKEKFDPNVQTNDGLSAVIITVTTYPDLLSHWKADSDFIQHVTLHQSQYIKILELLLDANASPVVTDSNGVERSSLVFAAYANNVEAVSVLMKRVEFPDHHISKALATACYGGHSTVINVLK